MGDVEGGGDLIIGQAQDGEYAGFVQADAGFNNSGDSAREIGIGQLGHVRTLQAASLILAELRRESGHTALAPPAAPSQQCHNRATRENGPSLFTGVRLVPTIVCPSSVMPSGFTYTRRLSPGPVGSRWS